MAIYPWYLLGGLFFLAFIFCGILLVRDRFWSLQLEPGSPDARRIKRLVNAALLSVLGLGLCVMLGTWSAWVLKGLEAAQ